VSLTCHHHPITAAEYYSFEAKIAIARPIILYKTAKIRTAITPEGIVHPFGAYMKGFEVVCNVLHTVMLAIPARTPPRSSKLRAASGACLDRRMGVWSCKGVNPCRFRGPH